MQSVCHGRLSSPVSVAVVDALYATWDVWKAYSGGSAASDDWIRGSKDQDGAPRVVLKA